MNELELDKECDQGEKSDMEVDGRTFLNCTEKVPDNNTFEIKTNSQAKRLSNILEDSKQLKNTDSETRLMHQKIEDEISRLEKAKWQYYASAIENAKACSEKTILRWSEIHVPSEQDEDQPDPSTDGNMLTEFQSDEEYMNLRIEELEAEKKCEQERLKRIQQIEEDSLIFNANNRLYSWRSLLDIMQTKFSPSYSPSSYGTRPHSAIQHTNNRNQFFKTNLIDRNFGLYFDLSDKSGTQDSHNRSTSEVSDNYHQNMGEAIPSQIPRQQTQRKYRSSRLSNIKLSVNVTDPGVSTGQSVDEDKASRPGTSSAVTLELARGNDIACELLSPDSRGMGDLKAKSVIDDCSTLGISSPELERTNGGVGRSSRLSNIKLSVNVTDPGVSTGQSVDEDKASRPGTSSAVTLELARGNDIACELLSPDSRGMGDLKAKSVIDDCSTLGISSPELERTNGGVGRSNDFSQDNDYCSSVTKVNSFVQYIEKQLAVYINQISSSHPLYDSSKSDTSLGLNVVTCLVLLSVKIPVNLVEISTYFTFVKILKISECNLQSSDISRMSHLPNLEVLDLSINKLSILDFTGINLTKLTILKLNNNQIKRISDITGHFPSLIILDVSFNFITSIDFQTVANSFPKLYELLASSNLITKMRCSPTNMTETEWNLSVLDVSDNQLVTTDSQLMSYSRITRLYLSSNILNQLCHSAFHGDLLQELVLDNNNLTSIDSLSECCLPNLIHLSMNHNRITEIPLLPFPLMRKLSVMHNLIYETENFLRSLRCISSMCEIDIRNNPCTLNVNFIKSVERKFRKLIACENDHCESTGLINQQEVKFATVNEGICQCVNCNQVQLLCEQYCQEYQAYSKDLDELFRCLHSTFINHRIGGFNETNSVGCVSCHLSCEINQKESWNKLLHLNKENILLNICGDGNKSSLVSRYRHLVDEAISTNNKNALLFRRLFNRRNKDLLNDKVNSVFQFSCHKL
nr:unnamed protein product [Trichobilharzia regenti]